MRVDFASYPGSGPDRINEDWVGATPTTVVVLDGVSAPPELSTGCVHGVPWYVRNLGLLLLTESTENPGLPLTDYLRRAVADVSALHRDTCDLSDPGTPSATVAMLRQTEDGYDYLVLSDAVLVIEHVNGLQVITDKSVVAFAGLEREAVRKSPTGTSEHRARLLGLVAEQRRFRNREGGYWLAGAEPDAASHALTGTVTRTEFRRAALMTDGASAIVDTYGRMTWLELLDLLESQGAPALLKAVRAVEAGDLAGMIWPRYKPSDDAAAALVVGGVAASPVTR